MQLEKYAIQLDIDRDLCLRRFEISDNKWAQLGEKPFATLWRSNPQIYEILHTTESLEEARKKVHAYLIDRELWIESASNPLHPLEKANVRECIQTCKNIISPNSEKLSGLSSLYSLHALAREPEGEIAAETSENFILEFIHLFRGLAGLSGIYSSDGIATEEIPDFIGKKGLEAALIRSDILDVEEQAIDNLTTRFHNGLQPEIIADRERNKQRILKIFGASEENWNDYHWHIRNVIRDAETLEKIVDLTEEETAAIRLANQSHIPFGITPYYASLMDKNSSRKRDYSVRMQVIPPLHYSRLMSKHQQDRLDAFDFMGERSTSPAPLVTRRYPQVAIFKPFNTCAQICVYCQRNWEIDEVLAPKAMASKEKIDAAVDWFAKHPSIQDVLITGGDPFILANNILRALLDRLAAIPHIQRFRIGTRTPVVLPSRITDDLVAMLAAYRQPGQREMAIVSHFENVWEITPETVTAISKLRNSGIAVYNQAVFTFPNSRRFEMVTLRRLLKIIGVDPYYMFNTKGKEETRDYRVPIARLLQERKEEARLLPGPDRTDESVFNVPRIGKNHLRAGQDHRVIMIRPDGRRIYEFLPWEKNIMAVPTYIYTDVPIGRYLRMLARRGENPAEYKTIWYYY